MASSNDMEAGLGNQVAPPAYHVNVGDVHPVMTNADVPQSYSSTAHMTDNASPPSYETLYGKMKAAKQESEGNVDFCKKFFIIILSTVGCTIMLAVILAVPVTMIIIGAIFKDDCPAERMIPIYLIVAGCFGIVKNLSNLIQRGVNKNDEDADEKTAKTNPFDAVLNCFLLAWFIAGNVWIYRTNGHWSTNSLDPNYCDPTLYWFAFWITTVTYIILGSICCCMCLGGILAICCGIFAEK